MLLAAPRDHGLDVAPPELAAVLVVVIATVGDRAIWTLPGPAAPARHRADPVHQRKKLGDVVAVGAGERDGERNTAGVDDQVVL